MNQQQDLEEDDQQDLEEALETRIITLGYARLSDAYGEEQIEQMYEGGKELLRSVESLITIAPIVFPQGAEVICSICCYPVKDPAWVDSCRHIFDYCCIQGARLAGPERCPNCRSHILTVVRIDSAQLAAAQSLTNIAQVNPAHITLEDLSEDTTIDPAHLAPDNSWSEDTTNSENAPQQSANQEQTPNAIALLRDGECILCHRMYVPPRSTTQPCGHSFCYSCISEHITTMNRRCPRCNVTIIRVGLEADDFPFIERGSSAAVPRGYIMHENMLKKVEKALKAEPGFSLIVTHSSHVNPALTCWESAPSSLYGDAFRHLLEDNPSSWQLEIKNADLLTTDMWPNIEILNAFSVRQGQGVFPRIHVNLLLRDPLTRNTTLEGWYTLVGLVSKFGQILSIVSDLFIRTGQFDPNIIDELRDDLRNSPFTQEPMPYQAQGQPMSQFPTSYQDRHLNPLYQEQAQPLLFPTSNLQAELHSPLIISNPQAQLFNPLSNPQQAQLYSPLDISNPPQFFSSLSYPNLQAQLFCSNPQQAQFHSPLNISNQQAQLFSSLWDPNPQEQLFSSSSNPNPQAQLFSSLSNLQQTQLHSPSTISNPQTQLFSSLWDSNPQAQLFENP